MGSRGKAPENFAIVTFCGSHKSASGLVLTLIIISVSVTEQFF